MSEIKVTNAIYAAETPVTTKPKTTVSYSERRRLNPERYKCQTISPAVELELSCLLLFSDPNDPRIKIICGSRN